VLWPFEEVTKVVGVPGSEDDEELESPPHACKPMAAKASNTIHPILLFEIVLIATIPRG
jgi:hypothetical protein